MSVRVGGFSSGVGFFHRGLHLGHRELRIADVGADHAPAFHDEGHRQFGMVGAVIGIAKHVHLYPAMHRIAHSLAGREDVARGVIEYVARRSVTHAPRFRDEADVERHGESLRAVVRAFRAVPDAALADRMGREAMLVGSSGYGFSVVMRTVSGSTASPN